MINCCQRFSKLKGAKTNEALIDSMYVIKPVLIEKSLRKLERMLEIAWAHSRRNIPIIRLCFVRSPTAAAPI
jgi:hypothetical protein